MELSKRPAMVHFTAADPKKAAKFYGKFFGIKFARAATDSEESYQAPVSNNGCLALITKPYKKHGDGITVYFAVASLKSTIKQMKQAGGKVTIEPNVVKGGSDMPGKQVKSLATFCEVEDEFGNNFGLVQFSKAANESLGQPANRVTLSKKMVTAHNLSIAAGAPFAE